MSVPNVVNPTPYTGHAGGRNYEGSVAWYRTSFQRARRRASTRSASSRPTTSPACGSTATRSARTTAPTCRSKFAASSPPARTRSSCASTGATPRSSREKAFTARGSTGAASTARSTCARSARANCRRRAIQTTLTPDTPSDADVKVSVLVHNYGPSRTLLPEGSLAHGAQTIPLTFAPLTLAHDQAATAIARRHRPRAGAVVAREPQPLQLTLAVGAESSYTAARRAAPAHLARRARVSQRRAAAPARRHHPGGRAGARRCPHTRRPGRHRRRAEGDRRQRRALAAPARPGAAGTPRRSRHPRLAGDRAGRRRRQLVLDHAAPARRSRAAGAHRRDRRPAAPVDLRVEPRR